MVREEEEEEEREEEREALFFPRRFFCRRLPFVDLSLLLVLDFAAWPRGGQLLRGAEGFNICKHFFVGDK